MTINYEVRGSQLIMENFRAQELSELGPSNPEIKLYNFMTVKFIITTETTFSHK